MKTLCAVLICIVASSACGGCDSGEPVGTPWEFNADAGASTDSAPTPDAPVATDTGLPPDRPGPPQGNNFCPPVPLTVTFDGGELFERPTRPVGIAGDTFWFVRADENGTRLFRRGRFDMEREAVRPIDALLDSGPGGVLYIADGEVLLYDPNNRTEQVLAPSNGARAWGLAPYETSAYRLVDREVVAWVTDAVYRARASEVAMLEPLSGGFPYVRDGSVAYSNNDLVQIETAGQTWKFEVDSGVNIALSDTHLWFRPWDGTMSSLRLDTLEDEQQPRPIRPPGTVSCDGLAVSEDGREVAASCVAEGGQNQLFYSGDGETWTLAAETDAPLQHTFAVGYGWVIYADFGREQPAIVAVPPGGEEPFEIGLVTQACLTCGAYWAPNYIEFENGLVAWNYAREAGDEFGIERLGMAQVCIIPR